MLGIGASSSAAYTLRKHYTKNLFPFECHFDRGGVDPLPIIQQIESGSKKKAPKQVSAPSPDANHKGSSNSQDSFQGLWPPSNDAQCIFNPPMNARITSNLAIYLTAAQIQSPPGSSSASMDSYTPYPSQPSSVPTPANYPTPANTTAPPEGKLPCIN